MELSIKSEFGDVMTAIKQWIMENNKQFKYKWYTIGKDNFYVSLVNIHFYSQKDIRLIFNCGEKEGIVYFTQIAELSMLDNNEVKISFDVTREGIKHGSNIFKILTCEIMNLQVAREQNKNGE